jgi:hypothetical protein
MQKESLVVSIGLRQEYKYYLEEHTERRCPSLDAFAQPPPHLHHRKKEE